MMIEAHVKRTEKERERERERRLLGPLGLKPPSFSLPPALADLLSCIKFVAHLSLSLSLSLCLSRATEGHLQH